MHVCWKVFIYLFLAAFAAGLETGSKYVTLFPTALPSATAKPVVASAGNAKPSTGSDWSKMSLQELLAHAKEVTQKTRDDLQAARGISLVKERADQQKATLDLTCSRLLGETLKSVSDTALKTHQQSIAMAKELEKRLAAEKDKNPKKV